MLNSIKTQLTLPTGGYALATGAVDSAQKGSSMNSSAYIINPSDIATAGIAGVSMGQLSSSLSRRAPGQKGSNRAQVLAQMVALDINGKPYITSCNITLTEANYFVPPTGVAYDQLAVSKAVTAAAVGYILNAQGATGDTQGNWIEKVHLGIIP